MRLSKKLGLLAASALMALSAHADFNDTKPITATVTGATATGYPRAMTEGLNGVVRAVYPDSAVSFKPNSPGGGVLAIANGQADFTTTATGTEVRLAMEGKFPFKAPLKGKFMHASRLFDVQYIHVLMTKEWADANGIKTWADIAAKKPAMRLAINRPDNPQTTIGGPYEMMKAHGFTIDDIPKWGGSFVLGNSSTGLNAILDGKADVFMNVRNLGDALIKDVHSKRPLMWIDDDIKNTQKAADAFNFQASMIPAGTYPFMDKASPTVRQWVALLVSAQTPDETVYKYVKALGENEDRVKAVGGSLKTFSASKMAENPANMPIHPGALRYFKEKGLVK
jgi:TRAP transporter TAXI family solute receptor